MENSFEIIPIAAFKDNYIWLLRLGKNAVVVDPGDAAPVIAVLRELSLSLTGILITHHHSDHIGGVHDLLAYQNGVDTLLATGTFPVQVVKEIRFILGPNNTIKDGGVVYPLVIPSGSESGLKIKFSKDLRATLETVIIDFDAALSVKKEGTGDYKLRPVLKIK